MGGFEGRKRKEEMMWLYYSLKIKERKTLLAFGGGGIEFIDKDKTVSRMPNHRKFLKIWREIIKVPESTLDL